MTTLADDLRPEEGHPAVRTPFCPYCGERMTGGTPTQREKELHAHVLECRRKK